MNIFELINVGIAYWLSASPAGLLLCTFQPKYESTA